MSKKDMLSIFHNLILERKERLALEVKKEDRAVALILYGEIAGIADSMKAMKLIDYDQVEDIKNEAWDIYKKKEPAFEGC